MSKLRLKKLLIYKKLIILVFVLFSVVSKAQPGSFEKTYGTNQREYAIQMILCDNGDFLALAWSGGSVSIARVILVIRLNYTGDTIWKRSLKDSSTLGLNPISCIQTHDKGFCILANPFFGSAIPVRSCATVIKIDSLGQLIWTTQISDQYQSRYYGKSMTESPNGNLYVTGDATYDCSGPCGNYTYVIKLNSSGQYLWDRISNSDYYNTTSKIVANSDSTLSLAINGAPGFYIVKFDSTGNTIQTTSYHNASGERLEMNDWEIDSSGYLKTLLLTNGNGTGVVLSKLNSSGNPISNICAEKSGFTLNGIQLLKSDTGYVALLQSSGSTNIVLTDWSDGVSKPNGIRMGINNPFYPFNFIRKPDGSLFVYGSLNYPTTNFADLHLVKTDITTNGILPLSGCSTDTTILSVYPINILDSISNFAFFSDTLLPQPSYLTDSSLVFNQYNICFATVINEELKEKLEVSIFPNPATTYITFDLSRVAGSKSLLIYDEFGKKILSREAGEYQIEFSIEGFASGIYFYQVENKTGDIFSGKFIIQ
ncbi:hypothetical protein BH09BAC5_BH09BAC5_06410 [soil metagenome]